MDWFRARVWGLVVLLAATTALPARGQAPAAPAPDTAAPVLAYRWPAPVREAPQPLDDPAAPGGTVLTMVPASAAALRSSGSRRPSTGTYTAIGAVLGALAGTAALYMSYDCFETGAMCGIGIPVFTGGGAVVGGLVGFAIGKLGN
jgi:hypothetical protein